MSPILTFGQTGESKPKLLKIDSTILDIYEVCNMCMIAKRYKALEQKYCIKGAEFSTIELYLGKPISITSEKVCNGEKCLHDEIAIYVTSSCYNKEVKGKIIMYLLNGKIAAVHLKYAG